MKTQLLIDADILLYRTCFVCEREHLWEDNIATYHSDLEECKARADDAIETLQTDLGASEDPIICFTSNPTFRHKMYEDYKGNRKNSRKPLNWHPLREYLAKQYKSYERPLLEADDCMGILATKMRQDSPDDRIIIVSDDKDMLQIGGEVYRNGELVNVGPEEAEFYFYEQVLTGDSTDNYPGCPGIGPIKARKLLEETERDLWWPKIVFTYKKAKLTKQDALVQARLAFILNCDHYDFKAKEPIMWRPPYV